MDKEEETENVDDEEDVHEEELADESPNDEINCIRM